MIKLNLRVERKITIIKSKIKERAIKKPANLRNT